MPRIEDIAFFTHGIRTAAVSSDFYSLALQLTNGHSVINVDWQSTPPSEEKVSLSQAYDNERRGAAQSYPKFEKALDDVINVVGPDRTIMIAFQSWRHVRYQLSSASQGFSGTSGRSGHI